MERRDILLKFQELNKESVALVRKFYSRCTYRLCEYSVGVKLMWQDFFHPAFAVSNGCLVVRNTIRGQYVFDYPVSGDDGDEIAAIEEIERYCREQDTDIEFSIIPEEKAYALASRYPRVTVSRDRRWQDYIYLGAEMAQFAGRKFSGQRNHINKFVRNYPEYTFQPLAAGEDFERFWREFSARFNKKDDLARRELKHAKELMDLAFACNEFCTGSIKVGDRVVAVCLGEKCGETMIVHIEKALYEYEGVYPVMVREFAGYYGKEVTYFNREDDACDKGLRTSKLQYQPYTMGEKISIKTGSELVPLKKIPELTTQRLRLTPLRSDDISEYNRLCLDDERNRWWGYDYRENLRGELKEDYFYKAAARDFRRRRAVNFAIRLGDKFIGEVVLWNFDNKGRSELGCRILPEFAGHGYGAEAFSCVADWALYDVGVRVLEGKCFKENLPSKKMLSGCMRAVGEDEKFFRFEKIV